MAPSSLHSYPACRKHRSTAARNGAVILPPELAFYPYPQGIDDTVRFVVSRVLVALGLEEALPEDLQHREKKD
jgi:3-polyprenyl-4-hydroxybenzoate decarboxylase|tara:strand:+ start:316 stop:534 length:219 start_codon:yes stop_codon:yes gene_type:complete